MARSKRPRGQHFKKSYRPAYENKQANLLFTRRFSPEAGANVKRPRRLPKEPSPYTRGEIPYPARPVPRQHHTQIDRITMGTTASLVGNDLLEANVYRWRGRANKKAHKVWAQIKDQLPSDAELARWSKRHELLRDDKVVWE